MDDELDELDTEDDELDDLDTEDDELDDLDTEDEGHPKCYCQCLSPFSVHVHSYVP
jgi:hypothetical protein